MLAPDGTRTRRGLRLVAQATVVASVVGATFTFVSMHKSITIDYDGEISTVSAYGHTVSDVLDFQDIAVAPADFVEPSPQSAASDGETIVVRTSHDITLKIDGEPQTFSTTARTVGELLTALGPRAEGAKVSASRSDALGRQPLTVSTAKTVSLQVDGATIPVLTAEPTVRGVLAEAGIVLNTGDATTAPLDAAVVEDMVIGVNRVVSGSDTVTEALPFTTEEIKDPTLLEGRRVVQTTGQVGEAVTTYAISTLGGAEVDRTVMTRAITKDPRNEVILVGTRVPAKEPVTPPAGSGSGSGGGAASTGQGTVKIAVAPGSARAIGRQLAAARGWGDDQFSCLDRLWTRESNWTSSAENRSSGAYGIPQALPGSKMASAGADWQTNPATQIAWGLGYISGRYGTPCGAWGHSESVGWY